MRRDITSWYSHNLNMDMPLVAYGDAGYPLLMFPTAAADYLEYERFYLVDAIKDFIEAGKIRAYSINSVNRYSLLNQEAHPAWKVELLTRYDRYITDEVLPLIRNECGPNAKPLTTGASLGALLAANTYFKHSDEFRGVIAMSGSYDIYNYLDKGFYDDNVYFNNPAMYLKNLDDDYHLPRLQKADSIVVVTGQGSFEAPDRSREFSALLHSKGIPHVLDVWGHDVNHDWVWWRKMLPYYLEKFCEG
ncbi:MAG TPA: alpha/beta hydrolase-fold protein [Pyrinomonadaceae bacterium]|jgi:esterase/lipase superfamily enzyme|nr:alpha/beta hydrolase-fold protein [Pyrinomonadaceae bacterium]